MKKRKKTLKVLAKENNKMTDWVVKSSDISEVMAPEENLVEMRDEEIAIEADQPNPEMIEKLARRNRQQEAWRGRMMVKEMVKRMVESVPAVSSTWNMLEDVPAKVES